MGDLQATIEFSVELYKFFNVDLFQRGLYQVRCGLRVSPRLPVQLETHIPDQPHTAKKNCNAGGATTPSAATAAPQRDGGGHASGTSTNGSAISANGSVDFKEMLAEKTPPPSSSSHGQLSQSNSVDRPLDELAAVAAALAGGSNVLNGSTACIINGAGASRVFQILYRNEEVMLRDIIHFRAHLLVDSRHLKESIERAEFSLQLELWFAEQNGPASSLALASTRTLQLNFHPGRGLHYHLPVLFDYFHLSAISVGIHASLVALHQPYIKKTFLHFVKLCAPKNSKTWIGGGKLNCRGNMSPPGPLEAVFFGPQVMGGGTTKCSGGPAGRLLQSRQLHREICSLLLGVIGSLRATLNEFSAVLTPSMNSQIGSPPLRENDGGERLQQLTEHAKLHDSEEDFAIRANSDIAQLCAESIMLWRRVLLASTQSAVHTLLAKKHHILRLRRFAEGFFVMENPRHSAAGCYDSNYQNYVAVAEMGRRSRYLQSLPPLPVHCTPVDGDAVSLPLIFEDRYTEPQSYARRRTGSDPHLNVHDGALSALNCTGKSAAASTAVAATTGGGSGSEKAHSINSLNGRGGAPNATTNNSKECSCGVSGALKPRFTLGGAEVLQASLTITPAVGGGPAGGKSSAPSGAGGGATVLHHQRHLSRHSVTGLLDSGELPASNDELLAASSEAEASVMAAVARHSKSLDQLDGTAQLKASAYTHGGSGGMMSGGSYRQRGGGGGDSTHSGGATMAGGGRSAATVSRSNTLSAVDTQAWAAQRVAKVRAEDLMRNINEFRQKYRNSEEASRRQHNGEALSGDGQARHATFGGTLNRQTEAHLKAGKFDYLHEIKMLNPPRQAAKEQTSGGGTATAAGAYYNSLPKGVAGNGAAVPLAAPRNSYPPIKTKHPASADDEAAAQTQAAKVRPPYPLPHAQNTLPRSSSSQALRRKNSAENVLGASTIPRSVEIARVRVSDLKEMLKNGTFRKESSSSESDIPTQLQRSAAEQRMLSSASVPFRLESYKSTSTEQNTNSNTNTSGFSESLPNLAPPPQFSSSSSGGTGGGGIGGAASAGRLPPSEQARSMLSNASTSSLSEESGWVSSRRSSCGPSSPDTITNEGKQRPVHVAEGLETRLNGEQLRLKLQKLLDQQQQQQKKQGGGTGGGKKSRQASFNLQTRQKSQTATPGGGAGGGGGDTRAPPSSGSATTQLPHKKVSSVTVKLQQIRNAANGESTEVEDMERPPHRRPRSGKHAKSAEKSKSEFDLTSLKEGAAGAATQPALESVRVPPPKQFQDDLLPPAEFRDPPAAGNGTAKGVKMPPPQQQQVAAGPPPPSHKPQQQQKHQYRSCNISPSKAMSLPSPLTPSSPPPPPPAALTPSTANALMLPPSTKESSLRQPIGAIDNPVYHIYESLKPIMTPAIFTNKPVLKSQSIVELQRGKEQLLLLNHSLSNGGPDHHHHPPPPPPSQQTASQSLQQLHHQFHHHHQCQNGAASLPLVTPSSNSLHNGHALVQESKKEPKRSTADEENKENNHHHHHHPSNAHHGKSSVKRSDSQKSAASSFKAKRKSSQHDACNGHAGPNAAADTAGVSLLEFEKYREEFRKQIKYNGFIYSDYAKLASELPYFYISDEYRAFSPHGMHLIICVHGLDGNAADLRLVRTYLELGLPGANLEFLMSERNQGDTFSDFDTMTDRLVAEILYHIETCGLNPVRISFVAHSLGTIIVRSALARPQMRPLLPRLHTFLSLSGPHLGTLYNTSGLVNMGMWFMQKWKKSGSLLQLCMRDTADLRNTFLYRLSQRSTLHHFKNILLCGSSQDRYVPAHSARLELCKAAIRDNSTLGVVYREMVHNIIAPILARPELTLTRFDVHHALPPHTANTLIGRAAHIAVLDSELFIEKFLLVAGLKYFS